MKGQNLRFTLGGKYIAGSTSCTIHVAAETGDSSTKDSTGAWSEVECVGKSWDGSAEALVLTADTAAVYGTDAIDLIGTTVGVVFQETKGDKNRVAETSGIQYTGKAMITDVSITAANKQNVTMSVSFQGVGALVKGQGGDTD